MRVLRVLRGLGRARRDTDLCPGNATETADGTECDNEQGWRSPYREEREAHERDCEIAPKAASAMSPARGEIGVAMVPDIVAGVCLHRSMPATAPT
jgi:hypothetical protein